PTPDRRTHSLTPLQAGGLAGPCRPGPVRPRPDISHTGTPAARCHPDRCARMPAPPGPVRLRPSCGSQSELEAHVRRFEAQPLVEPMRVGPARVRGQLHQHGPAFSGGIDRPPYEALADAIAR